MSNTLWKFGDPSVTGPNTLLGNGVGNEFTGTSELPGATSSGWEEIQWQAGSYFQPDGFSTTHVDSTFGNAIGYWNQGTSYDVKGDSSYAVYGKQGSYVYQMQAQGGNLNDVLIQTTSELSPGVYTFNHNITFTANEGLTNVSGTTGDYQAGNNFIVSYNYNGVREDFFLQVQVADSRGAPSAYSTVRANNIFGSIYNESDEGRTDYFSWTDTNGLKQVTVNLNEALLDLAKTVYKNTNLGSSVLDMSNWSLLSSYIGVESGSLGNVSPSNSTASFEVQNPEVLYDESSTFDSSDTGLKVTTISGTVQSDIISSLTTANNANADISLAPASGVGTQTIVANGYWDQIQLNNHSLISYVNTGASFSSNGGSLTLSGPGNTYISGSYSGLYISLNSTSSVNASLTGYSNIENSGQLALTGQNAYATITGNGYDDIVGSFKSLNLDISNGDVYSSISYNGNHSLQGSIINNGGNVNLTDSGHIYSYTNSGTTNISGTDTSNSELDIYGNNTSVYGSFYYIDGSINTSSKLNVLATNADIYNNGGNVSLTGSGGTLNINGNGHEDIVGSWSQVTATLGVNQDFNASITGSANMTINDGANASIWAKSGSATLNINGGTSNITPGTGYVTADIDMSSNASVTLTDFSQSHEEILLTNTTSLSYSYNSSLNETVVKAGNASLYISGDHSVSGVSSIGSVNFSSVTGKDTLALLVN